MYMFRRNSRPSSGVSSLEWVRNRYWFVCTRQLLPSPGTSWPGSSLRRWFAHIFPSRYRPRQPFRLVGWSWKLSMLRCRRVVVADWFRNWLGRQGRFRFYSFAESIYVPYCLLVIGRFKVRYQETRRVRRWRGTELIRLKLDTNVVCSLHDSRMMEDRRDRVPGTLRILQDLVGGLWYRRLQMMNDVQSIQSLFFGEWVLRGQWFSRRRCKLMVS